MRSLLDRSVGTNSDFYNSLNASEKSDFDALQSILANDDLLSEDLQLRSEKVQRSLNHSAMQSLAGSGTGAALSSMALGYFSQRLNDADFAELKNNRQSLAKALFSAILESGDKAPLSGALPGVFGQADVAAVVVQCSQLLVAGASGDASHGQRRPDQGAGLELVHCP